MFKCKGLVLYLARPIIYHSVNRPLYSYTAKFRTTRFQTGAAFCQKRNLAKMVKGESPIAGPLRERIKQAQNTFNDAGITVRLARPEDYDSLVELGQVLFDERDYLPSVYHRWLDDDDKLSHVAVKNGKVIAYHCAHVVENGNMFNSIGGRREPSFRGEGLYNDFIYCILDDIGRVVLDPTIWRGASVHTLWLDQQSGVLKNIGSRFVVFCQRVVLRLGVGQSTTNIRRYLKSDLPQIKTLQLTSGRIRQAKDEDLISIFNSEETKSRLFPDGYINKDFESFKPIPENLNAIKQQCDMAPLISCNNCDEIDAISFGTVFDSRFALRYNINYHGTDDVETIIAHVLRHMTYLSKRHREEKVLIYLLLPEILLPQKSLKMLKHFCVDILKLNFDNKLQRQYCFDMSVILLSSKL